MPRANSDANVLDVVVAAPTSASSRIRLWLGAAEDFSNEELDAMQGVLSAPERQRAASYYFERDRKTYVLAHAVMRSALALHTHLPPERIDFVRTPAGRPELANAGSQPVSFNLSHSRGVFGFALCSTTTVGLDVEAARACSPRGIAQRCLAPDELREWAALPANANAEWLLRQWTLKEALLKAAGLGLRVPLQELSIALAAQSATLTHAPAPLASAPWSLLCARFETNRESGARHALALAIPSAAAPVLELESTRALLQGLKRWT